MDNNLQRNKNGYINCDAFITIFVSVTLTCIIAIILVLTEGARMRACKLYYRIANNCAVDSMFSLYHLPLWEYYHLLGIEFKDEEMLKDEYYNFLKVHNQDENGSPTSNWFPARLEKSSVSLNLETLIDKSNFTDEINDYTKIALVGNTVDFLGSNISINEASDIDKLGNILKTAFKNVTNTSATESKQLAKVSNEYNLEKELSHLNILLTNISTNISIANEKIRKIQSAKTYNTFNALAGDIVSSINLINNSINKFLAELTKTKDKLNNLINKFQIDKISLSNDGIIIIEEQLSSYQNALDICLENNGVIETIGMETSQLNSFLLSMQEEIKDFIESIKELDSKEKSEAKKEFNEYIRDVAESIEELTYFDFNQGINEEEKKKFNNLIDTINNGLISLILKDHNNIPKVEIKYPNHNIDKISDSTSLIDKVILNEYCFEHFNYCKKEIIDKINVNTKSKRYEAEYLISGKNSDYESIKECINELFLMRLGLNLIYLYTNIESRNEAFSLASFIAPSAPLLVPVIQFTLLLAWGSAQTVIDLRNLYSGNRVPIMHSNDTFSLTLKGSLEVLSSDVTDNNDSGLNYKDYLRILLYTKCLAEQKEVFRRIINLIEHNIKSNLPNTDQQQANFNFKNLGYKLQTESTYKAAHIFSKLNLLNLFNFNLWQENYEIKIATTNSYANSILKGN